MVNARDVHFDSPWAQLPQIRGALTHVGSDDDENDSVEGTVETEQAQRPDSADQSRELCDHCCTLAWRTISAKLRNPHGRPLKLLYGEMVENASVCRICRLFKESIEECNRDVTIDPASRIGLTSIGKEKKRKSDEVYAISVNIIPPKTRLKEGANVDRANLNAGVVAVFVDSDHAQRVSRMANGSISGRKVREATDFSTVKSWLEHCRKHHVKCKDNAMYKTQSMSFANDNYPRKTLPKRTLLIPENHNPDVVYLEEHNGEREDYVALSYCWGEGANMIKTTKENLTAHLEGIEVSSLPKTFQDAIRLTREIGVQHLWIDSLCIIQDDRKDWATEANLMGRLYAGAVLTVAALSSTSADGGLFFHRGLEKETVELPLSSSGTLDEIPVFLQSVPSVRNIPIQLEDEAHSKRAWTFQERLLSPRVLYCASHQYYWECRETKKVEDGSSFPEGITQMSRGRTGSLIGSLAASRNKRQALDLWYEVVLTYSWRQMTYQKDKLTALGGLVKTFAAYIKAPYAYGIWQTDLAQALAWRRSRRCEALTVPENIRAPSWSWAARDGGLNYLNQQVYANLRPPAWKDMLQDPQYFKIQDRAYIRVTGLMWSDSSVQTVQELLDVRSTVFLDDGTEETVSRPHHHLLTCLALACVPSDPRRAHVLLLRHNVELDAFERIGIADVRHFQPLKDRMSMKTISLM